jgi:hypothetical protein
MNELLKKIDRAIDDKRFKKQARKGLDDKLRMELEISGMRAVKAIVEKHLKEQEG